MPQHGENAPSSPVPESFYGKTLSRLKRVLKRGGVVYTSLYAARWVVGRFLANLDRRLVGVEQKRNLVEPWCISASRWTAAENKQLWDTHDWSRRGEEWTKSAEWKDAVINRFLYPYMPEHGTLLEIGPGGGRWTEFLQGRADRLIVVDVSEKALQVCRERFSGCMNIEFQLGNGRTLDVQDTMIDGAWSYDVFVHITPLDVKNYFREFRRILKPGAHAVIHHPGAPLSGGRERVGWRSDLTNKMVLTFAEENGLLLVAQTNELVNQGEYLSVFKKVG
jgi:ubiquinone/menaquinone biosynthesis C-methylase UbiE